ncbi:hypothetical protein [Streptomyces sp. NPDC086782]|uniref:hypothetical protein n=1 Tax=Streptomyces sp. NPDC086782 TaxID=3365757 RepID=UPI003812774B
MEQLHAIVAGWPALPPADQFKPDMPPVPREEWPPLELTWCGIRPTVLHFDRYLGARTDSLLRADGAPAPIALVSWCQVRGARYGHGWMWRCEVHVITASCDSAGGFNFDCTATGRSTTRDGARDAAAAHITTEHPDVAVPYLGRRQHALRRWI